MIEKQQTLQERSEKEVQNFISELKKTEKYTIYGETTSLPDEKISPKFSYFYRPYNFPINTKMYMTYQEDEGSEKLQGFGEYVRLKKQARQK